MMNKSPFIILLLVTLLMMQSSCATRRGPEHFYFGNYSDAEEFYNKGQYDKAIVKYQAYIDENPQGNLAIISQYYIGKSKAALGQNEEAKNIFKEIIQNHPNLVWANFSETQLKELNNLQQAKPAS